MPLSSSASLNSAFQISSLRGMSELRPPRLRCTVRPAREKSLSVQRLHLIQLPTREAPSSFHFKGPLHASQTYPMAGSFSLHQAFALAIAVSLSDWRSCLSTIVSFRGEGKAA